MAVLATMSTDLQTLILASHNAVTDVGVATLAVASPSITHIDLTGCYGLSDVGLETLTACARLQSLAVSHAFGLTDAGLGSVLRACRALPRVRIQNCPLLSDEVFAGPWVHSRGFACKSPFSFACLPVSRGLFPLPLSCVFSASASPIDLDLESLCLCLYES